MSSLRNHEDCQELPCPVCAIMKTARSYHVQSAQSCRLSGATMSSVRNHEDCHELPCQVCAIMKTARSYHVQSAQS
ncbi:hypothetical protein DPMN_169484 [Dreissena polymorpha]|uniref:Uncharacterized protein n=1 Tax=Dreissena polymorpha TaxID=45954 RepID=A0A9D4DY05_DREPO|nr:hypothetical protein DPMN_169484 [Dreissena polymorpha]